MKTLLTIAFAAILAIGLCGCNETTEDDLPSGATEVKECGHHWYTFEMKIDGKTHKFLYRRWDRGETCCEISRQ